MSGVKLIDTGMICRDTSVQIRALRRCTRMWPSDSEESDTETLEQEKSLQKKGAKIVDSCYVCLKCGQVFTAEKDIDKHFNVCRVTLESTLVTDEHIVSQKHLLATTV